MPSFSERYGYIKPSDAFIRGYMPEEVSNLIATRLDVFGNDTCNVVNDGPYSSSRLMPKLDEVVWSHFLNKYRGEYFQLRQPNVIVEYILDPSNPWNKKLDLLEFVIELVGKFMTQSRIDLRSVLGRLISGINKDFKRLNYGYQIVNGLVTEITNEQEIQSIEQALAENTDNVRMHLSEALAHYSDREEPDYRASIKESISAVEALCNDLTGVNTLSKALRELPKVGINIQPQLFSAFNSLYGGYASSDQTGIRHGAKEGAEEFLPTSDEAYFMLISCSAFINYLKRKSALCKK